MVKYLLLCLLCLGVVRESFAQDTLRNFYDKHWEELKTKEGAYYYRVAVFKKGLWHVEDYFVKNNQLQNTYSCSIMDSIKEGHYVKYYENGFKKEEGDFLRNYKVGKWNSWFENGKKSSEEVYLDKLTDIQSALGADTVLAKSRSQAMYGYDGIRQGKCTWYHANGRISSEEVYKKGKIQKAQQWNEEGKPVKTKIEDVYNNTRMPQFNGNISTYLGQHIHYPADAREAGIEGRELVNFAILEDGTLADYEIIKSVSGSIDTESLRVVRSMNGMFTPGMAHNRKQKFYYTLPIRFKLAD